MDRSFKRFLGLVDGQKTIFAGLLAEDSPPTGYLVDHRARITLIDREGTLRSSYGFETPVEDIVHDLKLLLQ